MGQLRWSPEGNWGLLLGWLHMIWKRCAVFITWNLKWPRCISSVRVRVFKGNHEIIVNLASRGIFFELHCISAAAREPRLYMSRGCRQDWLLQQSSSGYKLRNGFYLNVNHNNFFSKLATATPLGKTRLPPLPSPHKTHKNIWIIQLRYDRRNFCTYHLGWEHV